MHHRHHRGGTATASPAAWRPASRPAGAHPGVSARTRLAQSLARKGGRRFPSARAATRSCRCSTCRDDACGTLESRTLPAGTSPRLGRPHRSFSDAAPACTSSPSRDDGLHTQRVALCGRRAAPGHTRTRRPAAPGFRVRMKIRCTKSRVLHCLVGDGSPTSPSCLSGRRKRGSGNDHPHTFRVAPCKTGRCAWKRWTGAVKGPASTALGCELEAPRCARVQ